MITEKTAAISELLLIKRAELGCIKLAWDAVFGEGAYKKMAGDMYDALNAKAAEAATKH